MSSSDLRVTHPQMGSSCSLSRPRLSPVQLKQNIDEKLSVSLNIRGPLEHKEVRYRGCSEGL